MFLPLAVPLATQLFVAVADGVPTYDVTRSCRAAAAATGATQDRLQTCLDSEQRARVEAQQHWSEFTPADRSLCAQTASAGGMPTYTELLTCLEMARDIKNRPSTETLAPMTSPTTSGMAHRQPRPAQLPDKSR